MNNRSVPVGISFASPAKIQILRGRLVDPEVLFFLHLMPSIYNFPDSVLA